MIIAFPDLQKLSHRGYVLKEYVLNRIEWKSDTYVKIIVVKINL